MSKRQIGQLIGGGLLFVGGLAAFLTGLINYTQTEKINGDDPMFPFILWGSFALLIGMVVIISVITGYRKKSFGEKSQTNGVIRLAQAALFAALAYIFFTFFRFDITLPGGATAFHLGNTFVVLAALLLGGSWGGIAGAVGLTIADVTTVYVTSAPKTFFLKLCIGLITGFVAHRLFRITKIKDKKKLVFATFISVSTGLIFNVIADPIVGYLYKRYLFGIPQEASAALAKIATVTSGVNAGLSILCAVVLYLAIRPVLMKAGLFHEIK